MIHTYITRRQWLYSACCLSLGMTSCATAERLESIAIEVAPYPRDANEALARLKQGNRRFMADTPYHIHEKSSWRSLLVETQKPFATVIGCSDSRVPPELIFDVGFGDLFTIRLAGNIIEENVIGSLQYAVAHLHTRLVIVLGHEGCGAVTATVEEMLNKAEELKEFIRLLVEAIRAVAKSPSASPAPSWPSASAPPSTKAASRSRTSGSASTARARARCGSRSAL